MDLAQEMAVLAYSDQLETRVEQLQRELNGALDVVAEVDALRKGTSNLKQLYAAYDRWAQRSDQPARVETLEACAREYEINPEFCSMAAEVARSERISK